MGIPLWKSALFFILIAVFGITLLPSRREAGRLFTQSGLFDKARFYLEKQFHQDPEDLANAKRYLGSLLYHGEELLFTRTAERLVKSHPDSAPIHEVLAKFHEDKMSYEDASRHWLRVFQLDPHLEDFKEKLLSYYALSKRSDDLIRLHEMVINAEYADLDVYYTLARLYSFKRRAREAQSMYLKILERSPYEEKAKTRLAEAYEFSGDADKAISLYREFFDSNPQNVEYALRLAEALLRYKKEEEEALSLLEMLTERFSEDDRFLILLADLYVELGKRREVIPLLETLYARNPNNHRALKSLGELYYETKDYTKALKFLKEYHEKTGGDYHSHHILGDLLAAMGDTSGSEREFKKALELIRSRER